MATRCRRTRALLSSQFFSIGTPRPLQLIIDDGRSPGSRVSAHPPLPGFGQWDVVNALSAYSCGGSHGFGPFWVVLTVFPFQPLQGHLEAAPSG